MKTNKQKRTSTQEHLPIREIREDAVILKNGGLRAVILVSSINFDLKSEEEQNATIGSYVSFLNGLQHPIQIIVQSRQLNIEAYLQQVKQAQKQQLNELLRLQTAEYYQYIGELVKLADIMTKRYYIVVPYDPVAEAGNSFMTKVQRAFLPGADVRLSRQDFAKRREKLEKRVSQVFNGIMNIGLNAQRLDTQSLIELYYTTYNPVVMDQQRTAADVSKLEVDMTI